MFLAKICQNMAYIAAAIANDSIWFAVFRNNTIYENQIISSIVLSHSHSGNYQTFLNIDENYATGSYYLQLEYDGKKSTPIPFNIIREFEKQKEPILGFGDYTKPLYKCVYECVYGVWDDFRAPKCHFLPVEANRLIGSILGP